MLSRSGDPTHHVSSSGGGDGTPRWAGTATIAEVMPGVASMQQPSRSTQISPSRGGAVVT